MPDARIRDFRDPIHGFIRVFPHEKAIIDTFAFQRLRRISQLGLSSFVYHGAEHSRFGHCLGVMHVAGEATSRLLESNRALISDMAGWPEAEFDERSRDLVCLARIAGLLHDIGHAPFSHVGESSLFQHNLRHEDYSAAIVENTEIGQVIDTFGADTGMSKERVASMLRGGIMRPAEAFVKQLLDSPWDVDKMDYLLRDSHYCGVEYGTFDIRRLVGTLALKGDEPGGTPVLAVEQGGYHTLEALVIARYFMFTQVYFHRVRRANDLVLTEFVAEILREEYGTPHYPELSELDEYLRWDDTRVLSAAVQRADASTANLAWMLCNRRHPKTAYETLPHPDRVQARTAFVTLLPEVRDKFPDVRIWRDRAIDHPERYRQHDIPIKVRDDPPSWRSFVDTSGVLRGLDEVGQVRLYAQVGQDESLLKEIGAFCRSRMAA